MKPKVWSGFGVLAQLGLLLVLAIVFPSRVHAAVSTRRLSEIARGRMLTFTCIGCHGLRGIEVTYPFYNVPKVAGQNRLYLFNALMDYRKNLRNFPTMRAQAQSMTVRDLRDIAAYFASLRNQVHPRTPLFNRSEAKAGAKMITTCAACHGLHGIAVAPEFPDLAGQYPSYLVRALKEYQTGLRKNAIMNSMAANLTHRDMVDIANYFASQKGPLGQIPKR
ncbi:MAG: c-type cytochrome [Gammaproteobacteria bacterium]